MKKILFLCTGNSCRSLIAEAIINSKYKNQYIAESAGSFPTGFMHPKAYSVLKKNGVSPNGLFSKSWDVFENSKFDYVITVCNSAANETCPVFMGRCEKLYWSIADPAKVLGSEEEIEAAFEQTFQELSKKIETELNLI